MRHGNAADDLSHGLFSFNRSVQHANEFSRHERRDAKRAVTPHVWKRPSRPKTPSKLPAFPLPPGLLFYAPPPVLRQAIVSDFPPVALFSECLSFYNPAKHPVSINQAAEQRAASGSLGGPSLRRLLHLSGLHHSARASFIRIHPDCTQVMVGPTVTVMAAAAANQAVRMQETTPVLCTFPAAFYVRKKAPLSFVHVTCALLPAIA